MPGATLLKIRFCAVLDFICHASLFLLTKVPLELLITWNSFWLICDKPVELLSRETVIAAFLLKFWKYKHLSQGLKFILFIWPDNLSWLVDSIFLQCSVIPNLCGSLSWNFQRARLSLQNIFQFVRCRAVFFVVWHRYLDYGFEVQSVMKTLVTTEIMVTLRTHCFITSWMWA